MGIERENENLKFEETEAEQNVSFHLLLVCCLLLGFFFNDCQLVFQKESSNNHISIMSQKSYRAELGEAFICWLLPLGVKTTNITLTWLKTVPFLHGGFYFTSAF